MNISYNFYIKKVFYACYVKNVVLPIDILKNERNKLGIKNVDNYIKLRHNNVRTKCKLVQKSLHNFYNTKVLSFLTLTYHKNEIDNRKAKKMFVYFLFCYNVDGMTQNVLNIWVN